MYSVSVYSDPDLAYVYPLMFSVSTCNDNVNQAKLHQIKKLLCVYVTCNYEVTMTCESPPAARVRTT